jgi:hypothetical protein
MLWDDGSYEAVQWKSRRVSLATIERRAWTLLRLARPSEMEAPDDELDNNEAELDDSDAFACYRAVRRWITRKHGRAHRSCVGKAERRAMSACDDGANEPVAG